MKYTVSFNAGGFLFEETVALVPLLQSNERVRLINSEIKQNNLLLKNSENARKRVVSEIKKRYHAVSVKVWQYFLSLTEQKQKIVLFYVFLKAYPILYEFQFKVVLGKWRAMNLRLDRDAFCMFLDELAEKNEEVDRWTTSTKNKAAQVAIRILKEIGMLNNGELQRLEADDDFWAFFVDQGDPWMLEAALLNRETRNRILKVTHD